MAVALTALAIAQPASATHPRPNSALKMNSTLVPAFEQCTATNRTHGGALSYPSCNPIVQSSASVTVGTTDSNGAGATMTSLVRLIVLPGTPGGPDDSDVRIAGTINDVRCKGATTACGPSNAAAGADYTGELQVYTSIRITDHFNAPSPGGGSDPATVADLPLPVNVSCAATAATTTGGTCSLETTLDSVVPADAARDGMRAVMALKQLQVWDGGPDGLMSSTPNKIFAVQGVFVP